jgi:hypothetical protein
MAPEQTKSFEAYHYGKLKKPVQAAMGSNQLFILSYEADMNGYITVKQGIPSLKLRKYP